MKETIQILRNQEFGLFEPNPPTFLSNLINKKQILCSIIIVWYMTSTIQEIGSFIFNITEGKKSSFDCSLSWSGDILNLKICVFSNQSGTPKKEIRRIKNKSK